jgi:hypothetical protein
VSNKQRIGFSEVQLVQKMIDGVTKLIALEKKLAGGASAADIEAELAASSSPAGGSHKKTFSLQVDRHRAESVMPQ